MKIILITILVFLCACTCPVCEQCVECKPCVQRTAEMEANEKKMAEDFAFYLDVTYAGCVIGAEDRIKNKSDNDWEALKKIVDIQTRYLKDKNGRQKFKKDLNEILLKNTSLEAEICRAMFNPDYELVRKPKK